MVVFHLKHDSLKLNWAPMMVKTFYYFIFAFSYGFKRRNNLLTTLNINSRGGEVTILSLSQYTYSLIVYNDNSYNIVATFTKVQGPKEKTLDFSVVMLDFFK